MNATTFSVSPSATSNTIKTSHSIYKISSRSKQSFSHTHQTKTLLLSVYERKDANQDNSDTDFLYEILLMSEIPPQSVVVISHSAAFHSAFSYKKVAALKSFHVGK